VQVGESAPATFGENLHLLSVLIQDGGILTVMAEEWRIRHKDENLISSTRNGLVGALGDRPAIGRLLA
jgi:hypothetical protein